MNQKTADVYCNKCDQIINREQIKEFLEEEKKTEILKEFENLWKSEGKFIFSFIFFFIFIFFIFIIFIPSRSLIEKR
jgi:hypothetical protein